MMEGHARGLMTPHATTVRSSATLRELAQILDEGGFSGVPVVGGDDRLVGFLSELDIAHAMLSEGLDRPVADVMTEKVVTVDEFATTDEVVRLLRQHRIHHLPVVRAGIVVGIVTPMDVIRHFVGRGGDAA